MSLELNTPLSQFVFPQELLSFVPRDGDLKQHFKGGDWERKIYCNTALDDQELVKIEEFRQYQKDQKLFLPRSMEARILRYISHTRGDIVKAATAMQETSTWREEFFKKSLSDSDPDLLEALQLGFISFLGRDDGLRPVMFLNVKVATAHPNVFTPDRCLKLIAFCMEFALRFLFLPGRVESQVVVIDLKDVSMYGFPTSALKPVISLLGKHYVGRLYQMYVVNAPYLVTGLYSVVKPMLSDRQQNKIIFVSNPKTLFPTLMALHHLYEAYGGTRKESSGHSYPFEFLPGPFTAGYSGGPNPQATPDCHLAVSRETIIGTLRERSMTDAQVELPWSAEARVIFEKCGLSPPSNTSGGKSFQVGQSERMSLVGDAMERAVRESQRKTSQNRPSFSSIQEEVDTGAVAEKPKLMGGNSVPEIQHSIHRVVRDPNAPFDITGAPAEVPVPVSPKKAAVLVVDGPRGVTAKSIAPTPAARVIVASDSAGAADGDGDRVPYAEDGPGEADVFKPPIGPLATRADNPPGVFDCLVSQKACGLCNPRDTDEAISPA
mmetsp:Transcript_86132/g.230668  ORF Transcript_86132/g.230668 Transcript_86132/m.230668 type:complete len:549 (+) Transcript_86132:135-1781(+)